MLNISRGGASFLCNERMKAGKKLVLKMNIPGQDFPLEILASVKWISKNPEESYAYRTGVAFNTYGSSRNENPTTVLEQIQSME